MMEFFLSKFWAFLVALAVMGVLVQGIGMDARSDQAQALGDLAEDIESLFRDIASVREGLETTVPMDTILTDKTTLTIFDGYALLANGDQEVRFGIPSFTLFKEDKMGDRLEVDALVLTFFDTLQIVIELEGPSITALSP